MEKGWRTIPQDESDYEFMMQCNVKAPFMPDSFKNELQRQFAIERYNKTLSFWCKVLSVEAENATIIAPDNTYGNPPVKKAVPLKYLSKEYLMEGENEWKDKELTRLLKIDEFLQQSLK